MKACLSLRMFDYIDILFNKIVMHSSDNNTIELNPSENHDINEVFIDEELFMILFDQSVQTRDLGRVMWILQFLDEYIVTKSPLEDFRKAILDFLKEFEIEGRVARYQQIFESSCK